MTAHDCILVALSRCDEPTTAARIAVLAGYHERTVRPLLHRLERDGVVEQTSDARPSRYRLWRSRHA